MHILPKSLFRTLHSLLLPCRALCHPPHLLDIFITMKEGNAAVNQMWGGVQDEGVPPKNDQCKEDWRLHKAAKNKLKRRIKIKLLNLQMMRMMLLIMLYAVQSHQSKVVREVERCCFQWMVWQHITHPCHHHHPEFNTFSMSMAPRRVRNSKRETSITFWVQALLLEIITLSLFLELMSNCWAYIVTLSHKIGAQEQASLTSNPACVCCYESMAWILSGEVSNLA